MYFFGLPPPSLAPRRPHQVDELGDGDLPDGFLHAAQGVQRRAEAAGQVVPRDGDEEVLAAVQVQHQDVVDGVPAGVEQRDGVLADVHLQVDLQVLTWRARGGALLDGLL